MSEVIKYLCETHRKMDVALRALSGEIHNFEEGETLDYGLVAIALEYSRRASCLNHHEVEDEMYHRILQKDPQARSRLQDVVVDHEKLTFLAKVLSEAVANVEWDNELPRYWLVSVAKEYLNAEWRHMHSEEQSLYPAAKKLFSDQDWLELSGMLNKLSALDFIRTEVEDLEDMYQDITKWSGLQSLHS